MLHAVAARITAHGEVVGGETLGIRQAPTKERVSRSFGRPSGKSFRLFRFFRDLPPTYAAASSFRKHRQTDCERIVGLGCPVPPALRNKREKRKKSLLHRILQLSLAPTRGRPLEAGQAGVSSKPRAWSIRVGGACRLRKPGTLGQCQRQAAATAA